MSIIPTQDELCNALAWFTSPVTDAIERGKKTASDIADWLWVVIQGDFAEEQTTAQIATGTIISMIPFVDQICDIRDLCANSLKIKEDSNDPWAWLALILTLIGLFPVLGSLFKGIIKVLLARLRRLVMRPAQKGLAFTSENLYKAMIPTIEKCTTELKKFIARPEVKKAIQEAGIQDIYKETAKVLRTVKGQLTTQKLTSVLDGLIANLKDAVTYIEKWGSPAIVAQAKNALVAVNEVRKQANTQLAKVLHPVTEYLERLAQHVEKEGDQNFKVTTNVKNLTAFRRVSEDEELAAFKKNKPNWVHIYQEKVTRLPFPEARRDPKTAQTPQHPSLGKNLPKQKTDRNNALEEAYKTFAKDAIKAVTLTPGEVIVRVVAPGSFDNSICWMRKKEFDQLKNRAEWRDRFAVWPAWNANGEYVLYTVPKGTQVHAWEGPAASQVHKYNEFYLKGGGVQLVIDPNHLVKSGFSERKHTNWGYGTDTDIGDFTLVGVPQLETKMGNFSTVDTKPKGK